MKKVILTALMIATAAIFFSSCQTTHDCPAYGKVVKPQTEKVNG